MKKNRKALIAAVALLLVAGTLFAIWQFTRQPTVQGAKALTIEVVHRDGTEKTFEIRTDAEYLGEALVEHGIAAGEQTAYGLYITACDGETADAAMQEWWCLTRGGEMLMTGADDEPVTDGGKYELTLTIGYE